jgi:hypothetical protein
MTTFWDGMVKLVVAELALSRLIDPDNTDQVLKRQPVRVPA